MKRYKLIIAVLLLSLLLSGCSPPAVAGTAVAGTAVAGTAVAGTAVAGSAAEDTRPEAAITSASNFIPTSGMLECLYYKDRNFHTYDERSVIYDTQGDPLCGVAPHHLTAGHMIAGMYKTAAQRSDIETVVLVAPMHYDTANTLTTSMKGWNTAFGNVTNDTEITGLFVNELGAAGDDEMTEFVSRSICRTRRSRACSYRRRRAVTFRKSCPSCF